MNLKVNKNAVWHHNHENCLIECVPIKRNNKRAYRIIMHEYNENKQKLIKYSAGDIAENGEMDICRQLPSWTFEPLNELLNILIIEKIHAM